MAHSDSCGTSELVLNDDVPPTISRSTNQSQCLRDQKPTASRSSSLDKVNYDMNGPVYVIVINNNHFDRYGQRVGSKHDFEGLKKLFSGDRYQLQSPQENLKVCELRQHLVSEAKNMKDEVKCMLCFIMSHGNEKGVLGTDSSGEAGPFLSYDEIIRIFSPKRCPALENKPKIYINQSCRGDLHLKAVKVETDGHGFRDQEHEIMDDGSIDTKDVGVVWPTVDRHKAYRWTNCGAIMIQTFIEIYEKYEFDLAFSDIIIRLQHSVSKTPISVVDQEDPTTALSCRMMVEFEHDLLKEIFF